MGKLNMVSSIMLLTVVLTWQKLADVWRQRVGGGRRLRDLRDHLLRYDGGGGVRLHRMCGVDGGGSLRGLQGGGRRLRDVRRLLRGQV